MLCSTRRQQILDRIVKKEEQLISLNTQYDEALENVSIESYTLDTGNGKQSTKRRNPEEIQKLISTTEKEIDSLYRKIRGTGLVNLNQSRR